MVTKLISANSIIAKVMSDLNMSDSDVKATSFIEWIGEALEHIGAVHRYSKQVSGVTDDSVIEICGHQGKLPCNIKNLISAAYSHNPDGPWVPMRTSTNTFDKWGCKAGSNNAYDGHLHGSDCLSITRLYMDMSPYDMSPYEALCELNNNPNARQTLRWLVEQGNYAHSLDGGRRRGTHATDFTKDVTYSLKPGYINTNRPDGFVKIAYTSMPIDEDGYPMVPDVASVKEAVYWYVAMKWLFPKYLSGQIPQYAYFDAKTSWSNWSRAAYGELSMPNTDEMLTIKNINNQLYPSMRAEQTFYDTAGNRETLYDFNRRSGWLYQNPRLRYDRSY